MALSGGASMLKTMFGIDPEEMRLQVVKFAEQTSDVMKSYDMRLERIERKIDMLLGEKTIAEITKPELIVDNSERRNGTNE